jgi:hypothetical protein
MVYLKTYVLVSGHKAFVHKRNDDALGLTFDVSMSRRMILPLKGSPTQTCNSCVAC